MWERKKVAIKQRNDSGEWTATVVIAERAWIFSGFDGIQAYIEHIKPKKLALTGPCLLMQFYLKSVFFHGVDLRSGAADVVEECLVKSVC